MDWQSIYYEVKNTEWETPPPIVEELEPTMPFENIYAAALMIYLYYSSEQDIYRGHASRRWKLLPTLYRSDVGSIEEEIKKLSSFIRYLQEEEGFNFEDSIAIAKHYSEEAGVKSWILDVTFDYEVACFFASDSDREGEIGEIYLISQSEIEKFGSPTPKSVGEISLYTPEGVPRIERQSAAFLDRCHPALLNGFVHWTVPFKQQSDVEFSNPENEITEPHLLPDDDEYKQVAESWANNDTWDDIDFDKLVTPPHLPNEELTEGDFVTIAKAWLEDMETSYSDLDRQEKQQFDGLCELHYYCVECVFSDTVTSLHTLYMSIENYLLNPGFRSFEEVANKYIQRPKQRNKEAIRNKITMIKSSFDY